MRERFPALYCRIMVFTRFCKFHDTSAPPFQRHLFSVASFQRCFQYDAAKLVALKWWRWNDVSLGICTLPITCNEQNRFAYFMKSASDLLSSWNKQFGCLFQEIGKSLPITWNRQLHDLGVTYQPERAHNHEKPAMKVARVTKLADLKNEIFSFLLRLNRVIADFM